MIISKYMAKVTAEFETPIREIAGILEKGGIVGVATDTTYALIAALSSRAGVEHLRKLRNLPPSKPLSLLLSDLGDISRWAFVDRSAYRLMKRLSPGKYTFILRATKEVPRATLTNQRTVGIRIIQTNVIEALCKALPCPLISASAANREGGYAQTAQELNELYPELNLIIDSGIVVPDVSTIIDLTGSEPVILREGSEKNAMK